ncbi:recombinase zinc beta ribbon domain protein, partial [Clostridioides difficile DA00256]
RISTGKTALLSGLIKCGKCGSNMRITYKGKKTDKDLKYYCYLYKNTYLVTSNY